MTRKIIVANRLRDGAVVYLNGDGEWSTRILDSRIADDEAEAEAMLRAAGEAVDRRIVVDPTAIELADTPGAPSPKRLREAIRAKGPTVRLDLCRP